MVNASGEPVSPGPLLRATEGALKKEGAAHGPQARRRLVFHGEVFVAQGSSRTYSPSMTGQSPTLPLATPAGDTPPMTPDGCSNLGRLLTGLILLFLTQQPFQAFLNVLRPIGSYADFPVRRYGRNAA
jgi:hypothetical protein